MKHMLLSCLFAASLFTASAQTSSHLPGDAATTETTAAPKAVNAAPASNVVYITPENQWSMVNMTVTDNTAWFSNIKGLSDVRVFVTDKDGRVQIEQQVTARANGVDLSRLRSGSYFVTLINQNTEERKAFVLNR